MNRSKTSEQGPLERFFDRLGGDPRESSLPRLRAFQIVLALVIATEYWAKAILYRSLLTPIDIVALAIATVLAVGVVEGRRRRLAFLGFALLQCWYVWSEFPQAGNHRYLEAAMATLFAALDDEEADQRHWILCSVRWMVIVVLFYSGLHKLLHGYWTSGQFLGYSLWRDGFRIVLEPLFQPAEFARLTTFTAAVGDGPYTVSSLPVRLLSNAVWLAQLALALALTFRRTRSPAWVVAIALVVVTEVVARELMFGVEFAAAILLFSEEDRIRPFAWFAAGLLALLLLVRLGLLPGVLFH